MTRACSQAGPLGPSWEDAWDGMSLLLAAHAFDRCEDLTDHAALVEWQGTNEAPPPPLHARKGCVFFFWPPLQGGVGSWLVYSMATPSSGSSAGQAASARVNNAATTADAAAAAAAAHVHVHVHGHGNGDGGGLYTVEDTVPTAEDYYQLRADAGLTPPPRDHLELALRNTWCAATVRERATGEAVAMGRVLGDGGVFLFVTDIATRPAHRPRGLGARVMERLLTQCDTRAPLATVALLADPPGERLYYRSGFKHVKSEKAMIRSKWMGLSLPGPTPEELGLPGLEMPRSPVSVACPAVRD